MENRGILVNNSAPQKIHKFVFSLNILYTKKSMNNIFTQKMDKIEEALNKALNMDFTPEWQNNTFGTLSAAVQKSYIQTLIQPNKNLIDLGGKRWRPLLLILCYEYAAKTGKNPMNEDTAYALTPLVEFVHTASLIHDDIEDSADLRRGKPAAHITYGTDTAINCASWLYFQAPVCINTVEIPQEDKLFLYELYTRELRRLHLGQAMDIFWHKNKDVFPSLEEYKSMVKCKTGTLASLASQIGMIAGGKKEDAQKTGEICANIGIGFQILDDVINLTKGNPGKKRGDDIVEGKKSLPVLLHIQENPQDKKVISALMDRAYKEGIDSGAVEECIALLEKSGCIKKAAEQGTKLIKENCALLQDAPLIFELFNNMIPENFR